MCVRCRCIAVAVGSELVCCTLERCAFIKARENRDAWPNLSNESLDIPRIWKRGVRQHNECNVYVDGKKNIDACNWNSCVFMYAFYSHSLVVLKSSASCDDDVAAIYRHKLPILKYPTTDVPITKVKCFHAICLL